MLFKARSVQDIVYVVAGLAVILIGATVTGCLVNDDQLESQEVSVETPFSPAITRTIPASVEPEVVAFVEEPAEPREVTYAEAEEAFQAKRYDEAMELFMLYTAQKSENPWGYYMLGLSAAKSTKYVDAENAFELALELDPGHVKSLTNLGRVYLDTDRPDDALVRIEEALALDPGAADAYRLQGRAYHQLGRTEEAADAYREAIRIDDKDVWAMNNLALILMEQGLFDQALTTLARATELRNNIAVFFNNLGMALEKTGHYRGAEDAYRTSVTIDAFHEKATLNLARVESVVEDPYLLPVDLETLALRFVDEIESWRDEEIARELPVVVEPDVTESESIESDAIETETIELEEAGLEELEQETTDMVTATEESVIVRSDSMSVSASNQK